MVSQSLTAQEGCPGCTDLICPCFLPHCKGKTERQFIPGLPREAERTIEIKCFRTSYFKRQKQHLDYSTKFCYQETMNMLHSLQLLLVITENSGRLVDNTVSFKTSSHSTDVSKRQTAQEKGKMKFGTKELKHVFPLSIFITAFLI